MNQIVASTDNFVDYMFRFDILFIIYMILFAFLILALLVISAIKIFIKIRNEKREKKRARLFMLAKNRNTFNHEEP